MSPEDDPRSARAEELLWDHYRRALERSGQPDAASHLRHQAMARRSEIREAQGFTTVRFDVYLKTSDYSVQLNAEDGAVLGWYFDLLGENSADKITTADALRAAEEAAQPPADAVLAYARYEDVGGRLVFVAHWGRVLDGVPVERDFLHVYVNGSTGRAFGLFRKWHDVDYAFRER